MPQLVKVASIKELPFGAQMIVDADNVQVALFNVGGTIHAVSWSGGTSGPSSTCWSSAAGTACCRASYGMHPPRRG